MADANQMAMAQQIYGTIIEMLDSINFHYDRYDEDLVIRFTVSGDDIPMTMIFTVDPEREVVRLFSPMPFKIDEDKRTELALAVAIANYGLVNGSFDYDLSDGEIRFRCTTCYRDSVVGPNLFKYMLSISNGTTDDYNDKFMMLNKGMMTLQQFAESENH